jgi:hypothetical protein
MEVMTQTTKALVGYTEEFKTRAVKPIAGV